MSLDATPAKKKKITTTRQSVGFLNDSVAIIGAKNWTKEEKDLLAHGYREHSQHKGLFTKGTQRAALHWLLDAKVEENASKPSVNDRGEIEWAVERKIIQYRTGEVHVCKWVEQERQPKHKLGARR